MPAAVSEYLMRLASNANEMKRFRSSQASARQSMTEFGLSEEQQKTLLSRDSKRVSDAVADELPPQDEGQAISMTCNLVAPSD